MKLYKYFNLESEHAEEIFASLKSRLFMLSPYSSFNDLNEGRIAYEILDYQNKVIHKQVNCKFNSILTDLNKNFRTLCLTKNPTSECMWAHYANNHTGICVQVEIPDRIAEYILPISYNNEFQKLEAKITSIMTREQKDIAVTQYRKNKEHYTNYENYLENCLLQKLFQKSKEWEYEQEYRITLSINHIERFSFVHNCSDNYYIKLPIKSIILGKKFYDKKFTTGDLRCEFLKWVKSEQIPLQKIDVSNSSYELHLIDIENY